MCVYIYIHFFTSESVRHVKHGQLRPCMLRMAVQNKHWEPALTKCQHGPQKMERFHGILRLQKSSPSLLRPATPEMSIWVMSDPMMFGTVWFTSQNVSQSCQRVRTFVQHAMPKTWLVQMSQQTLTGST